MAANTTGLRSHYGHQIKYNTVTSGTTTTGSGQTTLTKLARIKLPKALRRLCNATELESTDGYEEVAPATGWKRTENLEGTALFQEGQFASLTTIFEAGTEVFWEVWFALISGQTTNAKLLFRGIVAEIDYDEISRESDDVIMVPFAIARTTAKYTFVQGS